MIKAFVITASHETSRQENVQLLKSQIPGLEIVEAIYPTHQKIPFLKRLISASKERTGMPLNPGEIGILLSNRKIWQRIVKQAKNDSEAFLVLESDSWIKDLHILKQYYEELSEAYDLFFFGAWSGHMKLERSSRQALTEKYVIGRPFIKTVYGAYAYSINRRAANYLLHKTNKISHPVDQFKYFIKDKSISMGGVMPEIISHHYAESTIGHPEKHPLKKKLLMLLLDIKNIFICYFK